MFSQLKEIKTDKEIFPYIKNEKKYRESAYLSAYTKITPKESILEELWGKFLLDFVKEENKEEINIVLSGSTMTQFFFSKKFKPSDRDIYITKKLYDKLYQEEVEEDVEEEELVIEPERHGVKIGDVDLGKGSTKTVSGYERYLYFEKIINHQYKGVMYQFIVVKDDFSVLDSIDNFDLTCCKIFYDGTYVYSHPELRSSLFYTNLDFNLICEDRVNKYTQRGFKIIDEKLNFNSLEFVNNFTETKFTDIEIRIAGFTFYCSKDLLYRSSKMIRTMLDYKKKEEKLVIKMDSVLFMTPKFINHALSYIYGLEGIILNADSFWLWKSFCQYLDIKDEVELSKKILNFEGKLNRFPISKDVIYFSKCTTLHKKVLQRYIKYLKIQENPSELLKELDEECQRSIIDLLFESSP